MTLEHPLLPQRPNPGRLPTQCAICGFVWDRQKDPFTNHSHTQAEWDAYFSTNGLPSYSPHWVKVPGIEYPSTPQPPSRRA